MNEQARAFKVATSMPENRLHKIHNVINDAIQNGDDCVQFRKQLQPVLDEWSSDDLLPGER